MLMMGLFSVLALALAVVGVFGVLAYDVSQRTTEFGIRMALGASRRSVEWLVLGRGLTLAAAGLAGGLAGGLALSRTMASLLFGITPRDPAAYVAAAALLAAVAALASWVPARGATRLDPARVLRQS
jgi:ABC-type antimicrobial peptide transport system permease subunit